MFHKRLLKEFKENQALVVKMVLSQWVMLIANVLLMIYTAIYINLIFDKKAAVSDTYRLAVILAAVLIVRAIMNSYNNKMSFMASANVKYKLRNAVYEKLMKLGTAYRNTVKTSEAVQISTEGIEQLEIYFGKYVPQFFYSLLAPITLFFIVGAINLKVAAVLLVCVPLIPISIVAVQKFAKKMLSRYWGTYTELGDSFLECLNGLTTLKIYQADKRYADKMDIEAEHFRRVTMKVLIMQLNSISIMDIVAYGGSAAGIILSILEFRGGNLEPWQCLFIIMVSAEFFLPLRLLGSFFHIAMNGNAAADKIFKVLDSEELKDGKIDEIKESNIELRNVTFGYSSDKNILNNISLSVKNKGITALAGLSGCGKSTIASLIIGENKVDSGSIAISGISMCDLSKEAVRRKITRIGHESYIFKGTVRDNLLMGNENASDDLLLAALKKVDLLELVMENGGLDMQITEKAGNISGGQRQRLALARAILHDSDIYILDEATSNIDVESENKIMEVVKEMSETKAIVLISHRLANVTKAHTIYVLENGSLKESGTHTDLIKNEGYYYKLYEKQRELEQYNSEVYT